MANFSLLAKIGVDSKALGAGLKKAKSKISSFSKSAVGQIARFGAAFAGVNLVKSIAGLGVAAAETGSKFDAVFGKSADSLNEKIQELRKTIPSTTAEMQDALSTFGAMATAFGMNEKAAGMFSVEMVKVAGDIASFHNLPIEDAFTKIRSAISGEFEPMKQLGIVINEARLKQEGLNTGIYDGEGAMNAAQKALAVQSIMIRDLGTANGDAAATSESAANKIKFLKKNLTEAATGIGTTMLPMIETLVSALARLAKGVTGTMESIGDFIGRLAFMEGMSDIRYQATLELRSEGAFEGLKGRGGAGSVKALTDARVKEIKAREAAKAAAILASEEEIKTSEDLEETLENQIETEVDPIRLQALKDRLKAYRDLLEAVGDVESLGGDAPEKEKEETEKEKNDRLKASGGISSMAAIAGGGRVGSLRPIEEKALEEGKKQTALLSEIAKNTKTEPSTEGFK